MPSYEETWPIAEVSAGIGNFTCETLDSSGAWVPADGVTIPEITAPATIGLKASDELVAIPLSGTFKMRFTFISPTGLLTIEQTSESVPTSNNPTYIEEKQITVSEVGVWDCMVEVLERQLLQSNWEVRDTWGPFPIAHVVSSGGVIPPISDNTKTLLIVGAVAVGAYLLLGRD
jgi:hypothetical protein